MKKAEPFSAEVILPRTYKDEKSLMKAVSKVFDTDSQKAVTVVTHDVEETLYGMYEVDFIKNAKVLPARLAKELAD